MKCPVCDKVHKSMLCPNCGFDSSKDYERYPTFGMVGRTQSASALRAERERRARPVEPVFKPEPLIVPEPEQIPHDEPKKRVQKKPEKEPWFMAPWFALAKYMALALVIVGVVVTIVDFMKPNQAENEGQKPIETVQMERPETTPPKVSEPERVVTVIAPQLTNVLRSDIIPGDYDGYYDEYPVLGSAYQRGQIRSVTFLNTLDDMPDDAWDVSEVGNDKVKAWVMPNEGHYDLYIGAEGGVWAGKSCSQLFDSYINASEITFGDAFHTENAQDMSWMFNSCDTLTTLDLSSFDTANVEDMFGMFNNCSALTSLDLTSFDTPKLQSMANMFYKCSALTSLDLSSFDTSNATNMTSMFGFCSILTDLKVGERFATINAETYAMFYDCPAGDDYRHLLN